MKNLMVHTELNTDNPAKAKKFYKALFAWKLTDMPGEMPYTLINMGSRMMGGGIQKKMMPKAPTAWLPYVAVADVNKTLAKAKKLGAKIVLPFTEIGDMGTIGIFLDPTGASLGVWAMAKKKPAKKSRK